MTTGKTIALTRWTFVGKVMSLLFNMMSRLVIAFLPRSKGLLISRLQALSTALQQFVNWELPDVQAGFRKSRRTRDQIANMYWIIEKAREFHKNIYFCFFDYAKAFDCVGYNKMWKILKGDGNTRPPYLSPEKPVCRSGSNRTRHATTDWFKIGKGVCQGCILSSCLFNL